MLRISVEGGREMAEVVSMGDAVGFGASAGSLVGLLVRGTGTTVEAVSMRDVVVAAAADLGVLLARSLVLLARDTDTRAEERRACTRCAMNLCVRGRLAVLVGAAVAIMTAMAHV